MEIKLNRVEDKNNSIIKYPVLAELITKDENERLVVLFFGQNTGIVVEKAGNYRLGEFSYNWISINTNSWKILPPKTSVTFTN